MNTLQARVESIEEQTPFCIVHLSLASGELKLVKTERPSWLDVGDPVECQIAEDCVSVCLPEVKNEISIENKVNGYVIMMRGNALLTELTVKSEWGILVALITADASRRLDIVKGTEVTLLMKALDFRLYPARMSAFA